VTRWQPRSAVRIRPVLRSKMMSFGSAPTAILVTDGEGLQIENNHRGRIGPADGAASETLITGDAVNVTAGDLPEDDTGVQIEHHYLAVMRDVQAAASAGGRPVVPTVIAWDRNPLEEVIIARRLQQSSQKRKALRQ
jgi:hypothetical protein